MPKGDRLINERLRQIQNQAAKRPVPIAGSKLDQITANKKLSSTPKEFKGLSRRSLLLLGSLTLCGASGVAGYIALINPTSNMQSGEESLVEPEIVNEAFELMTEEENEILRSTLFDFFNRFGIQEVNLNIIDSQFKDSESRAEIYASSGELQLDMELIRSNAAAMDLSMKDYFRLTLLDSLSATLQTPGGVMLPETTDVALPEGKLLGYKGFGAAVQTREGEIYIPHAEMAFRSAFANAVDPRYAELFGNKESIRFVDLVLSHYGISYEEALDFNRGHGLDHLLLRIHRDDTLNDNGEVALTIDDIHLFLMYAERANNGESAEELAARYIRLASVQEP